MTMELVNVIFGMKLRQARLDAGLPASELARQIRISPSYLTEIEKGRKYPKPDKIMKMAGALDLDYDNLISIRLGARAGSRRSPGSPAQTDSGPGPYPPGEVPDTDLRNLQRLQKS